MSHVEPPADAPVSPPAPAPEAPAAPVTPPPAAPAPPEHDGGKASDNDRIGALEGIVSNLTEAFSSLTDALTSGITQEVKPQKLPWTHRGGKHKETE